MKRIFQGLRAEQEHLRGQARVAAPDFQQAAKQGEMGKCWGSYVILTLATGER